MSNLPEWISVDERLPEHGEYAVVYKNARHEIRPGSIVFYVIPAVYYSDVRSVIAADEFFEEYMFNSKDIENTNSGFFSYCNEEGTCYMDIIDDVKYWMPTYGVCDTTTIDR